MRSITCLCERAFEADLPDQIDLDLQPDTIGEILDGGFFAVSCPNCGRRLKPELSVRLTSRLRGIDLFVLPEADRFWVYQRGGDVPAGCEVLIGYAELFERALMLRDGLEPRSMEVLKYYLLAKASATDSSGAELIVSYAGKQPGGKLRFQISGLRPEELAILDLTADRYERTFADLARLSKTEPFAEIFAGSYRSLRSLEASED
jgi:hypothetical protein